MPLPDAEPDQRIYALLKNTDLENLSFADFQGVAEKVYAEQGAEDTLRRIVLVNLARLAVAGEWNGLTETGGNEYNVEPTSQSATAYSTSYMYNVATAPPWGANTVQGGGVTTDMECWPFISPNTGNISKMYLGVNATVTNTVSMAIYSDDNGGSENPAWIW